LLIITDLVIHALVGICWDQWFPETARAMVLQGAEILFYPTAIGSEPQDMNLDSREHWKRVMQGHAGANLVLLVFLFIL
jgi:N-carbamoylputrescine amidase